MIDFYFLMTTMFSTNMDFQADASHIGSLLTLLFEFCDNKGEVARLTNNNGCKFLISVTIYKFVA